LIFFKVTAMVVYYKGFVAEQISFLIDFVFQTACCDRLYIHLAVQPLAAWQ
jgi:hypothetical protein